MIKSKDVLTITKECIGSDVFLTVFDHVAPDSKRALRILRQAIKATDFTNKEMYADSCYQPNLRIAATTEINLDMAQAIIKNLEDKYDIIIIEGAGSPAEINNAKCIQG